MDAGMAEVPGWKRLQVDLVCDGWLTRLSVRFQRKAPTLACRRAALVRREPVKTVRAWTLA